MGKMREVLVLNPAVRRVFTGLYKVYKGGKQRGEGANRKSAVAS
jgi:hypothetical protein